MVEAPDWPAEVDFSTEVSAICDCKPLVPVRMSKLAHDLSYVEVDIVDAHGVVVPQANNSVSFTISGPGTLVCLDAGDATNHDSYKGTSHAAFSGKLMAIVQSTTTAGTITLKATSGSLTGSSVAITASAPLR
jgi:hypothetical protein